VERCRLRRRQLRPRLIVGKCCTMIAAIGPELGRDCKFRLTVMQGGLRGAIPAATTKIVAAALFGPP
jgi:hypothetical protein